MTSRTRLTAILVILTLFGAVLPQAEPSSEHVAVVLEARPGADASRVLSDHRADDVVSLSEFDTALGRVPVDRLTALRADERVVSVVPDRPMTLSAAGHGAGPAAEVATPADVIGASSLWASGIDGAGATVAVVDTGIAPHPDLRDRITAVLDVSGDQTRTPDGHGHGTFMAGLVAGGGPEPVGVAPGAELIAVKVAGPEGQTSLSHVLAGLHAVARFHEELSIDVVLLAVASNWPGERDPLDAALEKLWRSGVTVVVAAGNEGPEPGTVGSPGRNPRVITVGALDHMATSDRMDDEVPAWSSSGSPETAPGKPELVAPGTSVVSLRVPESVIDVAFPEARVGVDRFRGSGTSMSAAVAAGAAALLLGRDPTLSPDQVKQALLDGTVEAPSDGRPGQVGRGALDLAEALDAAVGGAEVARPARGKQRSPGKGGGHARGGRGPSADWSLEAWTWKAWTWKAWTWKASTWKAWTWKAWTWKAWTWK